MSTIQAMTAVLTAAPPRPKAIRPAVPALIVPAATSTSRPPALSSAPAIATRRRPCRSATAPSSGRRSIAAIEPEPTTKPTAAALPPSSSRTNCGSTAVDTPLAVQVSVEAAKTAQNARPRDVAGVSM